MLFYQAMAEGCPVSDIKERSFCSAEEFCAGWEGWLEGAHSAQLRFDAEDMVCVGVLRAERNGFLFWQRRVISLVQDLGIVMVGLSIFLGIIISVGWFIWVPLMRGSSIPQVF